MYIIPSIYIRDKKTVRLATGGSLFNENPVEMAKSLAQAGAEVIYLSDLDSPPAGNSPNLPAVEQIVNLGLKVQLSGHIRSEDVVERYIKVGVERVIPGVIAYQKPDFLKSLCDKFPSKIATHIDVVAGKVVIKGWTVATRKTPLDYAEQFKDAGVGTILYSDIETDGKITPSDIVRVMEFSRSSPIPLIHSTDISDPKELELVLGLESARIIGTIFGKSMYSGTIDIAATITHEKENMPAGMDEPTLVP